MGKKNLTAIVLVVIFSVIGHIGLLTSGLPPTHDGEYHVVRFYEFNKALKGGEIYPRWASDLNKGYGVPLFNYVYPLPNYIASFFNIFTKSFIDAFKFEMFFAAIVGAIFFYLWSKNFWGTLGGITSSIFYTFAPYHFVDTFVRGSVGELWALALFPAFLWSTTEFIQNQKKMFVSLSIIFLALLVFSHNILALIFFIFSLFYLALLVYFSNNYKGDLLRNLLFMLVLGITLSSIFWLPAIFEGGYVVGLQINSIDGHFPEIYQLIFPSWGNGFSDYGLENQMSFQLGVLHLIAFLISFFIFFKLRRKKNSFSNIIIFFILAFMVSFFLMLKISLPIWKVVPFMDYFQFPWRLLSLEILITSFLAGGIFKILKSKIIFFSLLLLVLLFYYGYSKPAYYLQRNDQYYIERSNFIDGTNSPGNAFNTKWFNTSQKRKEEKIQLLSGKGKILEQKIKETTYVTKLKIYSESVVRVNTAYFPGWNIFLDNKLVKTQPDTDGLMSFTVPSGNHNIKVELDDTNLRKFASLLSLSSLGIFIIFIFFPKKDEIS